jgi:UDP-glucuronate 4-epimerase
MTVLVTGAAGFIGAHVAAALMARGDAVIGLDDLNGYYSPQLKRDRIAALCPELRLIVADLADPAWSAALAGIDIDRVVHLGAQAGVRHAVDHPHVYARSNVVGQLNVLEFARARRVRHLVYASSSSVYGGNASVPFRVEDRVDRPISLYAATKRAGELMAESYAQLFRLPQTGLRLFTVYGPWGRPDMAPWLFTSAILEGRPVQVFNQGRMRRDFTWVDDIVAGTLAALNRPPDDDGAAKPGGSMAPHAIYNLGNHRPEELGRFIDLIEQACGRPAIRELLPMQAGEVPATYADIAPAARDLGFAPGMSLDKGVPLFVEWFRSHTGR